jgi:hypothetical protein
MNTTYETTPNAELNDAHEVALIQDSLFDGVMRDIAQAKLAEGSTTDTLTVAQRANLINPERDFSQPLPARTEMMAQDQADKKTKETIAANGERIISLAEALELRRLVNGERQPEDVQNVDPEKAIFVVEGTYTKGVIARRAVAEKAMREVYKLPSDLSEEVDLSDKVLYQFGSGVKIEPTKKDKVTGKDSENPAYVLLHGLAGEYLPEEGEAFTEFEATVATALADGYQKSTEETFTEDGSSMVRKVELVHADRKRPKLVLIQPTGKGNLSAGYKALAPKLPGKKLFIASNGQYRIKNKERATMHIRDNDIDMLPPVAIGDEPGDEYFYRGEKEVVPERNANVYVNEFVIAWRLGNESLPNVETGKAEEPVEQSSVGRVEARTTSQARKIASTVCRALGLVFERLGGELARDDHHTTSMDQVEATSSPETRQQGHDIPEALLVALAGLLRTFADEIAKKKKG